MEKKTRRAEQAMQTRKKIFDAAFELLEMMPYEQITIKDIVNRANVSIGTYYLYFSTKMDVFYQTYVKADDYFVDIVAPMLTGPTARENMLIYFDQYAIYNSEYTSLRLTKLLYNSSNTYFLRRSEPGMLSVLREVIQKGLDNGELDNSMTAERIEIFLMDCIRGLVYNWCIRDGEFDLRKATQRQFNLLYRAIRKQDD